MVKCIAQRELLFSESGSPERKNMIVKLYEPQEVPPDSVDFSLDSGAASCMLELVGIEPPFKETIYGADSLHAVMLASDVDPVLKRLTMYFDFYFLTGEPYFG